MKEKKKNPVKYNKYRVRVPPIGYTNTKYRSVDYYYHVNNWQQGDTHRVVVLYISLVGQRQQSDQLKYTFFNSKSILVYVSQKFNTKNWNVK